MRTCTAIALLLLMSGCTHTKFVTIPCVAKDQALPAEPEKISDQLTGEADKDIRTVAGSALRLRAWGQGLRTIIEGCRA